MLAHLLFGILSILASVIPTILYVLLLWRLDRYEKEPIKLLAIAFFWGAVPATIAAAVIGRLNIMTATTSVILVGLGVDYAIHIIAAYTELRGRGEPLEAAVKGMFSTVGNGVLTRNASGK